MLCTQLFHEKLKSKLFAIVNFAFKVGEKPLIIYPIMIQQNGGGEERKEDLVLVKQHLKQLATI